MSTLPIPQGATIGEAPQSAGVPIPQGATIGEQAATPAEKPSFWSDPKAYLQNRSGEMAQAAQGEMNQAVGPESQGKHPLVRLGHSLLSLAPETAGVIDKLIAGGMDWKNAIAMASGAVDPAIPAAYFGSQGAAQLSGLTPGVNAGDKSPENVQNALLAGSAVAGSGAAAMSPGAGRLVNPKPAISRALLLGKTPAGAYESALKPSTTLSADERAQAVQTGLDNRIPVSKGGLDAIQSAIDDINKEIADRIQSGTRQGVTIDPKAVANRTADVQSRFATQVNPKSDLAAIAASKQEFIDNNPNPIPADKAQAMKVGTYRVLKGKFGEQGSASVEAQKALARGLKEEIATQFPELKELNAQDSKFYDLQPLLERAVNRIGNHQAIGLGTPAAASAGKLLTGSNAWGGAVGVLKAVLDNPAIKSRLAIALNKSGVPYPQAVARVSAFRAALGQAAGPAVSDQGDQNDTPNQ